MLGVEAFRFSITQVPYFLPCCLSDVLASRDGRVLKFRRCRLYRLVQISLLELALSMTFSPSGQSPCTEDCCRQRLLLAATELFMREGFRASVDRIAVRAGVARQTFYNHFSGKGELFSAVVHSMAHSILLPLDGSEGEMRERLLAFSLALRQRACSDQDLGMFRALIAETPRFPDLARSFFATGPEYARQGLAGFLARAMASGELRQDDPAFAAQMLLSMLAGLEHSRRLLAGEPLAADEDAAQVVRIVDCFLRAYAPVSAPIS